MPKRGRRTRVAILLVCLSTLTGLLVGEFVVSWIAPQELVGTFRILDERGLALHERSRRFNAGQGISYTFDGNGLRATGPADTARGALRILVLGDSFTFGWRLNDGETYVARLQRAADSRFGRGVVRLLAAGHSGWGSSDYLSFVEHHARELEPDAVLVFLSLFDIDRSIRNQRYRLVDTVMPSVVEQPVRHPQQGLRALARTFPGYQWLLEHSHLVQLARRVNLMRRAGRGASQPGELTPEAAAPEDILLARALFLRLRDVCASRGHALLVVTTGYLRAGAPNMPTVSVVSRTFFDDADRFFAEIGVPFRDVSAQLDTAVGGDYTGVFFPEDPHPNSRGARMTAELNWPVVRAWIDSLLAVGDGASRPPFGRAAVESVEKLP